MEAHNATTEAPTATNEHGHEFEFYFTGETPVVKQTFNDGSSTTFHFTGTFDVEVVRVGNDDSVMLKEIMPDGSWHTFGMPTELYNEIAGDVSEYVDDSEFEAEDSDDMDEAVDDVMAAFDEPDEISEGMELTEDGETVFLIKSIRGNDATVAIWKDGRRKRKQRMDADSLQSDYENGDLVVA